jgi:hypothetical protein
MYEQRGGCGILVLYSLNVVLLCVMTDYLACAMCV